MHKVPFSSERSGETVKSFLGVPWEKSTTGGTREEDALSISSVSTDGLHGALSFPPTLGRPTVVWCACDNSVEPSSIIRGCSPSPDLLMMDTPVSFTRWLVEQPRGQVTPWSILVVGWRSTKPCASAILAAHTGDISGLRPDKKRCFLSSAKGQGLVKTAVAAIIVALDSDDLEPRVSKWGEMSGLSTSGCDVYISRGDAELQEIVNLLSIKLHLELRGSTDWLDAHSFSDQALRSPISPSLMAPRPLLHQGTTPMKVQIGSDWLNHPGVPADLRPMKLQMPTYTPQVERCVISV